MSILSGATIFLFSRTNEDAKQKSKEITTIRIQIDRNAEESNEYRRKLELSLRDNARLQDELLNTARDNQVRGILH